MADRRGEHEMERESGRAWASEGYAGVSSSPAGRVVSAEGLNHFLAFGRERSVIDAVVKVG